MKELYLLDTSFICYSFGGLGLTKRLSKGLSGLDEVPADDIRDSTDMLGRIIEFNNRQSLVVTPEVVQEQGALVEILNKQTKRLAKEMRRYHRRFHSMRHESQRDKNDDFSLLQELQKYTQASYNFQHFLNSLPPASSMLNEVGEALYNTVLQFAKESHACDSRSPTLGKKLETDRKLIAAASALTCTAPTVLLTRDNGLADSLIAVSQRLHYLEGQRRRRHKSSNLPRHELRFYIPPQNGYFPSSFDACNQIIDNLGVVHAVRRLVNPNANEGTRTSNLAEQLY